MKKRITILMVLVAIISIAWTELQTLLILPNADSANLVTIYDKDRNELFNVNSVSNTITYGSGVSVSGGTLTSTTLTSPTISGFITGGSTIRGSSAFTLTEAVDTVVISGLLATDIVMVSGEYVSGVDQQDVLQAEIKADTLIVHRLASGESAGAYNWLVVR